MKLIELYIENFGKLTGYKYSFSSGLNVINEENGYGKSTLAVFIKSMLFGLEDTRKPKLDENDRKKYLPWQGGACGGTLTFAVGKKKYRIERTFAAKAADDTFALYDCESGKESKDYSSNIGEELFGINVDGFERTVFLSERRLSVKNDNKTISAKLSDLVGCDGDVGELDEAVDMLEERRKYYYKRGGAGRISEVRAAIGALDGEINDTMRISDALPQKEATLKEKEKTVSELEAKIVEIDSQKQTLSYEKQYLSRKAAKDEAEKKLAQVKAFFKGEIPTQGELRQAERAADAYRALKDRLAIMKDTQDKRDLIRRDIAEAEDFIERLGAKKEKKGTRRAFPALLMLAVVFAAVGGAIAAVVNTIAGAAMIGAGVIMLIAAVANLAAVKKSSGEDELTNGIRAMLGREGKSYTEEGEFLNALIAIRAKKESELELAEERAAAVQAESESLKALADECNEFLARFDIGEGDPYLQIREHISEHDYLTVRVKDLTAEVAQIVREYGVNVEKLNKSGNVILNENADLMRAELEERMRRLRGEVTLLQRECKRDAEEIGRLDELAEKKAELCALLADCEERLAIINHTKEHLTRAKDLLTAKYLGKTRAAFAEYMRLIGNEDPEQFTLDTSFAITKNDGGTSKPTEAYSRGMQDFFTLAARLALVETLYDKELPFVMLDDPFAHFDDKRCQTALKVLKRISEKNQIIYLTCSKSRAI
jgi:uncharacterized protein YhaN